MQHIGAFVQFSLHLDNCVKISGPQTGMQHTRAFVQSSLHLDTKTEALRLGRPLARGGRP